VGELTVTDTRARRDWAAQLHVATRARRGVLVVRVPHQSQMQVSRILRKAIARLQAAAPAARAGARF
jgi:hypothetical protein